MSELSAIYASCLNPVVFQENTKPHRAVLTSADGPVVAPGGQCLRDPLAGDALGALKHVAVLTGKLDTRTDPEQAQDKE